LNKQIEPGWNSSLIQVDEEFCESHDSLRLDLLNDAEFRYAYAESFLNSRIAAQIKVLREQRGMTQEQLAELIGTKQAGISRLENVNYCSWKTETLRRIARALGVRLNISFETFGSLLDEVKIFGRKSLERPSPSNDPRLTHPAPIRPKSTMGSTGGDAVVEKSDASDPKVLSCLSRGSSNDRPISCIDEYEELSYVYYEQATK